MNILEHPIYKDIYDLCQKIEELPASEFQTKLVTMAGNLQYPAKELVDAEKKLRTALEDAISTYGDKPEILVTAERIEAWKAALLAEQSLIKPQANIMTPNSQNKANLAERIAQITAHRACGNQEQDVANGKLAGYCVVCQTLWPCEIALQDGLAAAQESGKRWEEDATDLLHALDEEVTPETCDNAAQCALEKIKALKLIAFELAAHGDCHCAHEMSERCAYCIAEAVTEDMKPTNAPCDYALKV